MKTTQFALSLAVTLFAAMPAQAQGPGRASAPPANTSKEALIDRAVARYSGGSLATYVGCAGSGNLRACLRSQAAFARSGNTYWVQFSAGECSFDVYFDVDSLAIDERSSGRGFSCNAGGNGG